jgi:hypothetical protein
MKVRHLIQALQTMPREADVHLSCVFAVTEDGALSEVRLIAPISGLANNGDIVMLIVAHTGELARVGALTEIHGVEVDAGQDN